MCLIFFDVSSGQWSTKLIILFSQILFTLHNMEMVKLVSPEGSGFASVLVDIATFLYDVWNLIFLESLLPNFCVLATALAMMVVSEYVSTFYVLFLCIVFFNFIPCMPSGSMHIQLLYMVPCSYQLFEIEF